MQLLLYRTVRPPCSSQRYSIGRCSFWGDLFARGAAPWASHRRERKFPGEVFAPKKVPKQMFALNAKKTNFRSPVQFLPPWTKDVPLV